MYLLFFGLSFFKKVIFLQVCPNGLATTANLIMLSNFQYFEPLRDLLELTPWMFSLLVTPRVSQVQSESALGQPDCYF